MSLPPLPETEYLLAIPDRPYDPGYVTVEDGYTADQLRAAQREIAEECARLCDDADNCDNDGNLYDPGEEIPCPMCHPRKAIRWWTDRNSLSGTDEKQAAANARSLVKDIRKNRGVHSLRSNV